MSDIRVTNVKGRSLNIAPDFPDGANMTGVCTATSFSGDGSNLTGVGVPGVSTTVHAGFNDVTVSGVTTFSGQIAGPVVIGASANPYATRSVTIQPVTGQTNTYLSVVAGSTSGVSGITFGDAAGQAAGNYAGMFEYYHSDDSLRYAQNGSEKLRVDPAGNINISGIVTATTYSGDVNVGSAVTITSSGIEATGVGITCASINGGSITGRRNLIMNGFMRIDQRNSGNGVSIDPSSGNPTYGILDRWMIQNYSGEAARYDISRSSDVPSNQGFSNSLKIDVTTAMGTPSGNNYSALAQSVESQDCVYLNQGNANAESMTLQFWIKSTKTGTSSVTLDRDDGTRCYVAEYTINTTDTWEKKTITIPGDTTGTGCAADNGRGLLLLFPFFAGSSRDQAVGSWAARPGSFYGVSANQVNLVDDAANNIFITGVQLERGYVASSPEHTPYRDELLACQRYYFQSDNFKVSCAKGPVRGEAYSTTEMFAHVQYPSQMRAEPTWTVADNGGVTGAVHKIGSPDISGVSVDRYGDSSGVRITKSSAWTAGAGYVFTYSVDAEL